MCVTDAVSQLERLDGVAHVRLDRRRSCFVVRHETETVDPAALEAVIGDTGVIIAESGAPGP